ncbi:hypothetical protein [Devosia sediminis]|uniref:Uncharacterized protein n=1 Tax=Devosia sediminis TaxID=2798801 RepID=A0A934J1F1_9HYPH|nr:hypothetical protein [Devosia sediminis]MBJ3785864.1 hypothetical protein [Devosia sediminis]
MNNSIADSIAYRDELVVPTKCFEVKSVFHEEPDREIVREILDWVRSTGLPHEWRGHTHTKPPADGPAPKYLDEFDVPTGGRNVHAVAPCPCCSPLKAKYKRGGKIAWFPQEGVIRLIGPECYKSLNAMGHREAMAELVARRKREQGIRYLSDSLPRLLAISDAFKEVRKIAYGVDSLRSEIQQAPALQNLPLWDHCSQGVLSIFERRTEVTINKDGEIERREVDAKIAYASLRGFRILDPMARSFDMTLNNIKFGLSRIIDQITTHPDVSSWTDEDRRQALSSYNRTRRDMRLVDQLNDLQQFVGVIALPTLKRWGVHPGATLPIHVERIGADLRIGSSPSNWIKVDIPKSVESDVPSISDIDPGVEAA